MSSKATIPALYQGPQQLLPLFAHGNLADSAFVGRLLERDVTATPGELLDHRVLELPELEYPVLLRAPGESVKGPIYWPLSQFDYERLDRNQGVDEGLYRRHEAVAILGAKEGKSEGREVYVYLASHHTLERYTR